METGMTDTMRAVRLNGNEIDHISVSDGFEWSKVLRNATDKPIVMTKSLVLSASSKSGKIVLLVALARTVTKPSTIAKILGYKDLRMASQQTIKDVFKVEADSVSITCITPDNFDKVEVIFDSKLKNVQDLLAFRASSNSKSILLRMQNILELLDKSKVSFKFSDLSQVVSKIAVKVDKDVALIGITCKKDVDFSKWYQEVLLKSEMIDYYDISGCYVLRPLSFQIWERIQAWFDVEIKKIGVENAYFPMFISSKQLEREKDHIEGFSAEVAWITHGGQTKLEEPIAIRPTSETAIYPYYSKWIRSHRDLPLKYNQWNNVVRWEFKNPQPFLRTREFLWQEGHTVHLYEKDAMVEVLHILDLYEKIYTNLYAVPVIKGYKSENEKFAGSKLTTTIEGYIPTTGRGIQCATSHCLGQNFSKMFNITVEDPENTGKKLYTWQNSWGLSTRSIGVMVMVHGDDKGLKVPPMISKTQVVIIPCGLTSKTLEDEQKRIEQECAKIAARLEKAFVRVHIDSRTDYTPGWKFSHYEMKGIPLRIEFGPMELKKNQITVSRRDTGGRSPIPLPDIEFQVPLVLNEIQKNMYQTAKKQMNERIYKCTNWSDFVPALNLKNLVMMPWCNKSQCEDWIKENSSRQALEGEPEDERAPSMGAKSLCNPIEQPTGLDAIKNGETMCVACGSPAELWGLFGRSY